MNEHTIKHLELIQAVVARLAQNSFSYKGWAIALVSAILVIGGKKGRPEYVLVAFIPAMAFWGLDAYYGRQERLFRRLYDAVRTAPSSEVENSPFSMDISPYCNEVATWWSTCWSKAIAWLYGPIVLVILAVAVFAYVSW